MRRLSILVLAGLVAAPPAFAQTAEEEEIVVTAQRALPGSVPGDATPETTLSAGEVRSLGASSVAEVLAAIAPQTGSASGRGGGRPIVLLNGRRISGFQEIRDIPAEAISRVEVFDEQLSLQYGYAPDQRIVNIVLRGFYRVNTAEAVGASVANSERGTRRVELGHVAIAGGDRLSVSGAFDAADTLTELERGVEQPVSGVDSRAVRTLAPEDQNWRFGATYNHAINERLAIGGNLRAEGGDQQSLLGLDAITLQPLTRDRETNALAGAVSLDGLHAGWQWTVTGTADLTTQDTETTGALTPARSASDQTTLDLTANANGPLLDVPAGPLRGSARLTFNDQSIDARAFSSAGVSDSSLERQTSAGRFGLSLPLTSRRREIGEALGDIRLNASYTWSDLSDFGALSGSGVGVSWAPTDQLRFSLQQESAQAAPSLAQLGSAIEATPGALVYDFATGANVVVTRTIGGNPALLAEDRDDLTFNATWSPESIEGLTLTLGWARNDSQNVATALPINLPEAEAAFPTRFVRDGLGALTAIDVRPVNIAERETSFVRLAVSYSRGFGERIRPTPGSPPWGQGLPPWGSGPPPWGSGPPPWAGGARPPGAGGGPPGGRGGRGFQPGRFNVSLAYRERLADEVVLATGLAPIDLLDRGGLDASGETQRALEFEGGVAYRGLGLRLSGAWTGGYEAPNFGGGGALSFSDRTTLNLRTFVNFDQRRALLEAVPALRGARLTFSIENLTDSSVDVRDSAGLTPATYQEAYQNPLGRVVQVSLRKQW